MLHQELKKLTHIALTTDIWSSYQELTTIVSHWGSPEISCCVTDNASNRNCGIELMGWNHLLCFAHTLNLVVRDSLGAEPGLSVIKQKCKAIVAHFHRRTKSSEKLLEYSTTDKHARAQDHPRCSNQV
uniref:Uncharacterized protein n=1 Tax=Amphimedon queenslandica TaxID=400682 RepID=A0A1X7VRY8_AMPQE